MTNVRKGVGAPCETSKGRVRGQSQFVVIVLEENLTVLLGFNLRKRKRKEKDCFFSPPRIVSREKLN